MTGTVIARFRMTGRKTHWDCTSGVRAAFLIEARQILGHVGRAGQAARNAAGSTPTLSAGIIDAGYDTMPQILHELQHTHLGITNHQVESGTPEQYRQLSTAAWTSPSAPPTVRSDAVPGRLLTVWLAVSPPPCHAGPRIPRIRLSAQEMSNTWIARFLRPCTPVL
jgi:hypothetical protein